MQFIYTGVDEEVLTFHCISMLRLDRRVAEIDVFIIALISFFFYTNFSFFSSLIDVEFNVKILVKTLLKTDLIPKAAIDAPFRQD